VDQAFGARTADRLESDADDNVPRADVTLRRTDRLELLLPLAHRRVRSEADLLEVLGKFLREEVEDFLRFGRAGRVFNAGVDVLGVLPEDDHVHLLGMLHRRRHALVPAHRPQADVQVEQLPQCDVQGSDAAADGRRQRAFDADVIFAEGLNRVVRKPRVELLETLFAGVDFHPRDRTLAGVGFCDGRVEHAHARAPDVRSCSIAFNERNDRIVGNDEPSARARDRRPCRRRLGRSECRHIFLGQLTCRIRTKFPRLLWKLCGKGGELLRCYGAFGTFYRFAPRQGNAQACESRRPKLGDYTSSLS
jgi:hypothetical protein